MLNTVRFDHTPTMNLLDTLTLLRDFFETTAAGNLLLLLLVITPLLGWGYNHFL